MGEAKKSGVCEELANSLLAGEREGHTARANDGLRIGASAAVHDGPASRRGAGQVARGRKGRGEAAGLLHEASDRRGQPQGRLQVQQRYARGAENLPPVAPKVLRALHESLRRAQAARDVLRGAEGKGSHSE